MAPPKKKGITMDIDEFVADWAEEDTGPTAQWNQNQSTDLFASVGMATPAAQDQQVPHAPPYTARLGNLSYESGEEDVRNFFRNQKISDIRIPKGPENKSKGYAFVEFGDRDSLISALALEGTNMNGRTVRVNLDQSSNEYGRGPRRNFEEDNVDWTVRRAPSHAPREPRMGGARREFADEPDMDWGSRRAPTGAPRPQRSSRPPMMDEPDLDWSQRRAPTQPTRTFTPRAPRREPREEPDLDWSQRRAPVQTAQKKVAKPSRFDVLKDDHDKETTDPTPAPEKFDKKDAPKLADTIAAATASAEDDSWTTVKR